MSRRAPSAALAALLGAALLASGGPRASAAEADPTDAVLLYYEGKFKEGDAILDKAGPEAANDPKLRMRLGESAMKYLRGKTGEDRRAGLEAAKRSYGVAVAAQPENGAALAGAIASARELAELDLAKFLWDAAKLQATWALELGEKAAAAGLSPESKAALGEAYGLRAFTTRKVDLVAQACADYAKGVAMLEEAAAGHAKESEWLAAAADLRLKQAGWVHDVIPVDTEVRDDEALTSAIGLARRACEAKGAADPVFFTHLRALTLAHGWGLKGDHGWPFMKPLQPAVEGLSLQVPRGVVWTKEEGKDWAVALKRQYEGEPNGVQVLLKIEDPKSTFGGRQWQQIEDVVELLFDARKSGFGEVASEVAPVLLGADKKGKGGVWHFQVNGIVANTTRPQRLGEWVWASKGKKDVVYDMKLLDWRRPSSIEDPDLVMFVASAIGPGIWPAGKAPPAPAEEETGKGGKKPPKKK